MTRSGRTPEWPIDPDPDEPKAATVVERRGFIPSLIAFVPSVFNFLTSSFACRTTGPTSHSCSTLFSLAFK